MIPTPNDCGSRDSLPESKVNDIDVQKRRIESKKRRKKKHLFNSDEGIYTQSGWK
jgi:hypothetical protein